MLTCGFFNSVNGDRPYNAEQMNNPYKRIVSNGVFANPDGTSSNDFKVFANGNMIIDVNTGEGIFDGKWAKNDAPIRLTIPVADVSNPRIDSVIFRVNYTNRVGEVILISGTPSASPQPPQITRDSQYQDYRLANILVNTNATGITQANVTDTRAGTDCGFVTHLLQQADISAIYDQWQAQFEEWFQDVKETLATSTLIRSYTSRYTTTSQGETVIPINISQYNRNLDILQVFVNGLRLIPDEEYTVDSNSQITLAADVDSGTPVSFIVYKSVDGSEAETVVQQVYELQVKLDATKITADTGGTKLSVSSGGDVLQTFVNAGAGFHTMYSASGAINTPKTGAFRYFGHMTSATVGWLVAMQADGSVFANYYNAGNWVGWKTLLEKTPTALYSSQNGTFPNANIEITPSKPLSECQHGWQLIFNGYDDVNNTPRDYYTQSVLIPKRSYRNANWNGESTTFPLVYQYVTETDETLICSKTFAIYDTKLVSGSMNPVGKQRKMVLRAIYEY